MSIEHAHRLPSKFSPRPIIAKFSFFKNKEAILSKYRQLTKEKRSSGVNQSMNNQVRITEDFPARVTKARAELYPFLLKSIENGHKAFFKFDTLIIDGILHVYDDVGKAPVRQRKTHVTFNN